MLALSWIVAGWLVRRLAVPPQASARLVMGVGAFALLIAAETALGVYGFGRRLGAQVATYRSLPGGVGLAAQLLFALFPLLRR
jgi:hypothetical protein